MTSNDTLNDGLTHYLDENGIPLYPPFMTVNERLRQDALRYKLDDPDEHIDSLIDKVEELFR